MTSAATPWLDDATRKAWGRLVLEAPSGLNCIFVFTSPATWTSLTPRRTNAAVPVLAQVYIVVRLRLHEFAGLFLCALG